MPDRLLVPEKLYGRSREVETLVTAFDRMVTGGKSELVLVSRYSGIGKSSVVNELHKVLVPPRGLFASGKFDQCKRDIPYATLAQGFQSLVRYLLGKSDAELSGWRDALISDQFRLGASYVFLFLREARADMPVQVPTKYAQVIKLKTAKALDLTVPPSVSQGLCRGA